MTDKTTAGRVVSVLSAVCLVLAALFMPAAGASARAVPVLGDANAFIDGIGWGTVKPREISNGGAPSGTAESIRWRTWGGKVARGRGLTPIYHPDGNYYPQLGAIRFRATNLGRCHPGGPLAYRTLKIRIVDRPGGTLSKQWYTWPDICGG